jgi:hypothetical protein
MEISSTAPMYFPSRSRLGTRLLDNPSPDPEHTMFSAFKNGSIGSLEHL